MGDVKGPLASLDAFRDTQLMSRPATTPRRRLPAFRRSLSSAAYISSGTWSLVGTLTDAPVTTRVAFDSGYTNLGAATGDLMFHSLINSMWVLKQCMDAWAAQGRAVED